jgi:hypothetical protein
MPNQDTIEKSDFGLADRFDARIFEAGQSAGERHVGVQDASGARDQPVDRRVDAEGRSLYSVAGAPNRNTAPTSVSD